MALGRGKAVFFFEDGKVGWSETLYNNNATDLPSLAGLAKTLAQKRARMMGLGPVLRYIRVEDELVPRQTLASEPNYLGGTDLDKSPGPSEVPWSTVLCRVQSGSSYHRPMLLSGVPQGIILDPPGPALTTNWSQAFAQWVGQLTDDNWCFKVIDKSVQNPEVPVANAVIQTDFSCIFYLTNQSIPDYTKIRVRASKPKTFNGLFTVKNVSGQAGQFQTVGTVFQSEVYQGGGQVRVQRYALAPISSVIVRGEASRRRGRPFDSPRGRRAVRK